MQNGQLILNAPRLDSFSEKLKEERRVLNQLRTILCDCRSMADPADKRRYDRLIDKAELLSHHLSLFSAGIETISEDARRASRQIADLLDEMNYESKHNNYFDFSL